MVDADESRLLRVGLVDLGHARPSCWPVRSSLTIYVNPGACFRRDANSVRGHQRASCSREWDHSPRRAVMDMITKLPEMSDDALVNLRTNAKRLQQSGNPGQRSNAAALLPAVEAEIAARRLAKVKATRSGSPKPRIRTARPVKRAKAE